MSFAFTEANYGVLFWPMHPPSNGPVLDQESVQNHYYAACIFQKLLLKHGQGLVYSNCKKRYTPPSESFRTKLSTSGNITRPMFWNPYLFFVWADYLDILQYLTTIY